MATRDELMHRLAELNEALRHYDALPLITDDESGLLSNEGLAFAITATTRRLDLVVRLEGERS